MKSAVVILTLLGCDCDGVSCEYIRTVSSGWESVVSCQSSSEFQSTARLAAQYPLVVAHCSVKGGSAGASDLVAEGEARPSDVGEADTRGTTVASAETDWSVSGRGVRNLIASGASYTIRAVGSNLRTYAGKPVHWVSNQVFARRRD